MFQEGAEGDGSRGGGINREPRRLCRASKRRAHVERPWYSTVFLKGGGPLSDHWASHVDHVQEEPRACR